MPRLRDGVRTSLVPIVHTPFRTTGSRQVFVSLPPTASYVNPGAWVARKLSATAPSAMTPANCPFLSRRQLLTEPALSDLPSKINNVLHCAQEVLLDVHIKPVDESIARRVKGFSLILEVCVSCEFVLCH